MLVIIVAGTFNVSVEEFGSAAQASYKTTLAGIAGVSESSITLSVAGASLSVTATFTGLADAAREGRPFWAEVPEGALLDQHGVMELTLKQLVDRLYAAGTPHSLRMHHRCVALLADLDENAGKGASEGASTDP